MIHDLKVGDIIVVRLPKKADSAKISTITEINEYGMLTCKDHGTLDSDGFSFKNLECS